MNKTIQHLKKFWRYVWHGDTLTAYFLNIILAFIIIKYLVYPGLGIIFGTGFPVVAVVSSSMEHQGSFDEWWESQALCGTIECSQEQWYRQYDLGKSDFDNYFFKNGFNKGDVMVLFGTPPDKIKQGDTIVFHANQAEPVIHRVISIQDVGGKKVFATKGDNNPAQLAVETYITEEQVIGRAVFRIPLFGYIKIWFVQLLQLFSF